MSISGFLFAAFSVFLWGTTFVSTKALLNDFSAAEILVLRFLIAYIGLWAICPRRLRVKDRIDELWFALAGLSGIAVYQLLENLAIQYTNASNVSIIVSVCPIFTALSCQLFLRQKNITWRFLLGFAIAIFGIALVSLNGISTFHFHPTGDILALAAAFVWGFFGLFTSLFGRHGYSPLAATRRVFFYALLFMVPIVVAGTFFVPAESDFFFDFSCAGNAARFSSPSNWLNGLYLGLLASAGCFASWNRACERLGTVRANIGLYLVPVITLVFANLFLGERLSSIGILGALCTLAGVILSTFHPAGRPATKGDSASSEPFNGERHMIK